jgi:hypothetical protein
VLSLSGGVQAAPFAAGVLVGWTQSGTRPTFDVVNGISSGALIGALAFLGPKYDADLQHLVLTLSKSDLFKLRPVCCVFCDGAFGTAKPTERLIQSQVNDRFLTDLRQAHAEGRRFFVGTMNVQTKRLVIWDVGAIASSGRPDAGELVRKVLQAAIAWPGVVPPVEFNVAVDGHCYREEHYDGGTAAMAFARFGPSLEWSEHCGAAGTYWPAGSNLYVLPCRKLYSDRAPVPKRAVARTMVAVSATLEALTRADIVRLYYSCVGSGIGFHLLTLPQDYRAQPLTVRDPYPKDAWKLFETGYEMAVSGPHWRRTPPGTEPGEETMIRDLMQIEPAGCGSEPDHGPNACDQETQKNKSDIHQYGPRSKPVYD